MLIELKSGTKDGLSIHFLEFLDGRMILQTSISGTLINSITENKSGLLIWKQRIAKVVHSKRKCKQNTKSLFAVSLGMRFYPWAHGSQSFDIENFLKPILDGIATGLFCENSPDKITSFKFDDSNFIYLYFERLPDAGAENEEGVVVTISEKQN